MGLVDSALIDFTEAAYDLEVSDKEWLPRLLERGLIVDINALSASRPRRHNI